jgi:Spt4/RpoE2 zinc finger
MASEEGEEEVPEQIAELAQASVPSSLRGIRACKRCGILKTVDQFINEGCENCPFLDMVRTTQYAPCHSSRGDAGLWIHPKHTHTHLFGGLSEGRFISIYLESIL